VVRIDNRESPGRRRASATATAGLITSTTSTRTTGYGTVCHPPARAGARVRRDVPGCAFVIWLSSDYPNRDADRYTGGVRLRSPFGTVIDVAVWHGVEHVTETGDAAPGFGPFELSD
jgi:hypothetical protein